jgi:hypothetical protein
MSEGGGEKSETEMLASVRTPAVVIVAAGAGVPVIGVSPSLLSPSYSRSTRFRVLRRVLSIAVAGTS